MPPDIQHEEKTTSTEDRFFGVRTTIGDDDGTADEGNSNGKLDLEIVDDRPPADRRPPKKEAANEDDDDDLTDYSDKVKKRINKLKYEQHELRREKEAAERMREEAITLAQTYQSENSQYQRMLAAQDIEVAARRKAAADATVANAKSFYKQAFDSGDTDEIIEAQERLDAALAEARESTTFSAQQAQRKQQWDEQQKAPRQAAPRQQPQVPKPSSKALAWAEENPWFGSEKHKDMTALAYGVHEKLVRDEGVDPNSDEYFEQIDTVMRSRFPEHFEDDEDLGSGRQPTSTRRTPGTVVAPAARANGSKPRKVKLTTTALALAKRLGLTPEQYANQVMKEQSQ
jgi:hypothetical protein